MCDYNCSACTAKSLFTEEYAKLLADGVPAGSAVLIAYKEIMETEKDLGLESFLETLGVQEFAKE
jgi:hypothetical protein